MTIHLTKRQAEALWVARETGYAGNLRGRRTGGATERMLAELRSMGLLSEGHSITTTGLAELALWEQVHPKTKLNPERRS